MTEMQIRIIIRVSIMSVNVVHHPIDAAIIGNVVKYHTPLPGKFFLHVNRDLIRPDAEQWN